MQNLNVEQLINNGSFEQITEYASRLWNGDETVKKDRAASFALWQKAYQLKPDDNLTARRMGSCYRYGYGTKENDDIALSYYLQGANRNDTFSQYFVGLTLKEKKDPQCVHWFEKACNNGDMDSAAELGCFYMSGTFVSKDVNKAQEYFDLVDKSEEANPMMDIMRIYYFGPNDNGEKDLSKAIYWCKKAATFGNVKAVRNLATLYEEASLSMNDCADFLKTITNNGEACMWLYRHFRDDAPSENHLGLEYLQKAYAMKYPESNYELGRVYFNGFCNVAVDKHKAITIWKEGIELDDSNSILMCAYDYINGEISEQNVAYGLELLEKSSALGNCAAKKQIGVNYLFGYNGVSIDYKKALEYLVAASEKNIDSDALIGYMYLNGLGVEKNVEKAMNSFDEAISYGCEVVNELLLRSYRNVGFSNTENIAILKKAAYNNEPEAMLILYNHYKNGTGVIQDINEALDWLYIAVDMNDATAYCELGNMYFVGNEQVEKNEEKGFKCYLQSYQIKENAHAAQRIVECFYLGLGVEKNIIEAEKWAKKATAVGSRKAVRYLKGLDIEIYGEEQGYINYMNFILNEGINNNDEALLVAYEYYRNVAKDYQTALSFIEKSFQNQNPAACFVYGYLFYCGEIGVEKNINKAYAIWEKGAEANSIECLDSIGQAYLMGEHYEKNIEKGLMYLKAAAERGNGLTAFSLGTYYVTGLHGVPINNQEGVKYFEIAANLGHIEAKNELGTYYLQGSNGLPLDIAKGLKLVMEAADGGSANAQFNMGNFYYNGRFIGQDRIKSIEYYRKAATQGHTDAKKVLELLNQ